MKVYAVVYSNYEPVEVNSLWFREEEAAERAKLLNSENKWKSSWSICEMEVRGQQPHANCAKVDCLLC